MDIIIKGIELEKRYADNPEVEIAEALKYILYEISGNGKEVKDIDCIDIITSTL